MEEENKNKLTVKEKFVIDMVVNGGFFVMGTYLLAVPDMESLRFIVGIISVYIGIRFMPRW